MNLQDFFQAANRFSPSHQLGKATGNEALMQYSPTHRMAGDWTPPEPEGLPEYESNPAFARAQKPQLETNTMRMQQQLAKALRGG